MVSRRSASRGQPSTRTEVALGVLLVGLPGVDQGASHAATRRCHDLAQLSAAAAAFGIGWLFYLRNLSVTGVLLFAANTSFGGLPVLMG